MARRAGLNGGASTAGLAGRMLLIGVAVLLAHGLAIEWLARQQAEASALRAMPTPMLTRLLQPDLQSPPPKYEPKVTVARVPRASAATKSIAPQASLPLPTPTLAEVVAPEAEAPAAVAEVLPSPFAVGPIAAPEPPAEPESTPPLSAGTSTVAPTPTVPSLDSWPVDTRLTYVLSGRFRSGELYGDARVQWQRDGERYQTRVEIDVTPFVHQSLTSQGRVAPEGLLPGAYQETRRNKHRSVQLGDDTILLEGGRSLPRPPGVQDTASQFVELAHRFATGRELLEVGRSVSFWMARPGALDLWTYDIAARETLATKKLGPVEAFHLKPRPIANPRGNITAEMWFAPSLQYLPVRIRVSMGDEAVVDLLVDTIEQK